MREKIQKFMVGRYGFDNLSRVCLTVTVVLMIASMLLRSQSLYLLGIFVLAYCYYRAFSRNIAKRQREREAFGRIRSQGALRWHRWKARQEQKKLYRLFTCPQCRQNVRVPRGKGKICITCPKCRSEFIRKS